MHLRLRCQGVVALAIASSFTLALVAAPALAQGSRDRDDPWISNASGDLDGMPAHGGFGRGQLLLQGLDLSSDQRRRIADIRDRNQRASIRAGADLRIARLDLFKLLHADRPDRRAIDAQLDRLGVMRTAMQKSHMGAMLDVRSVLTDAQRDKLRERHFGGQGMHGRGGRGEMEHPKRDDEGRD